MVKFKKLFFAFVPLLIGLYLAVCGYFFFIQETIIFNPRVLDEAAHYDYSFNFEERWFEPEADVRIHAIHAFTEADSAKGLVIYLHGNRGTNQTSGDRYRLFLDNGYDMVYPDYRTYGKSRGDLNNEEDLVGDIRYVFEEMAKEYGEDNIILVGYSLGSGVASQVAKVYDPKMLIMWAPFYSLIDVKDSEFPFLPDILMKYPLRTDLALKGIEEPVHILYAVEDELLPIERSIKLTDHLKEGDTYSMIEEQGHGWFYQNRLVIQKMNSILSE
jgi:hypothetical protein